MINPSGAGRVNLKSLLMRTFIKLQITRAVRGFYFCLWFVATILVPLIIVHTPNKRYNRCVINTKKSTDESLSCFL